jgi:hypothetical protein
MAKSRFDWEEVRAYAKGKKIKQIIEHFGMSFEHCGAYLKKHNIQYEKRFDAMAYLKKFHKEIVELFNGGATERSVAIKYKVATATIRSYMRRNGISRNKKPVQIKPPVTQPNCWQKSDKAKLPAKPLKLKKLKVYPLPEAGQCKYPDDDFNLCTERIASGSYCAKHNDICYMTTNKMNYPKEATSGTTRN